MKTKKQSSLFILIILGHLFFSTFIYGILFPIHFVTLNFFILALIGKTATIPYQGLIILDLGNLFLLWFIGRKVFQSGFSLIPPLIYAISPWSSYLVAAGSFYIYLLFLSLNIFSGLLILRTGKSYLGFTLVVIPAILLIYSSVIFTFLVPTIFIFLVVFKIFSLQSLKIILFILIITTVSLIFIISGNHFGFKNIFNNEIEIFSDPGLLNMVNSFQGEAQKDGFGNLAKISENKYIFYTEYVGLKYTKQLIPATYFTSQEKLLKFSFTPPVFLGFLIPFLYGLYKLLLVSFTRRSLFLSTLLGLPSILSKQLVDLNRLIIFAPVVIFVISYGVILLIKQRKEKLINLFLILTIFLVLFQLVVTLSDISLREKDRFIKYYEHEQNYEIGKQ